MRSLASGRWSNPPKSHREQESGRTRTQILWLQSSFFSLLFTTMVYIHRPPIENHSEGPPPAGRDGFMFSSTSTTVRESIRTNISFYQICLRPQAIVCPFRGTICPSDFQCKQQIWINYDGVLGSSIYRLADFSYPRLGAFFGPKSTQSWSHTREPLLSQKYKCRFSCREAQEKTLKQL